MVIMTFTDRPHTAQRPRLRLQVDPLVLAFMIALFLRPRGRAAARGPVWSGLEEWERREEEALKDAVPAEDEKHQTQASEQKDGGADDAEVANGESAKPVGQDGQETSTPGSSDTVQSAEKPEETAKDRPVPKPAPAQPASPPIDPSLNLTANITQSGVPIVGGILPPFFNGSNDTSSTLRPSNKTKGEPEPKPISTLPIPPDEPAPWPKPPSFNATNSTQHNITDGRKNVTVTNTTKPSDQDSGVVVTNSTGLTPLPLNNGELKQ